MNKPDLKFNQSQEPPTKPGHRLRLIAAVVGIGLALLAAGLWLYTQSQARPDSQPNLKGLRPGREGGPCEGAYEFESFPDTCTHGPDPGGNFGHKQPTSLIPSAKAAASVPCVDNGHSGNRVQIVHAYKDDPKPMDFALIASQINDVFRTSARETGGDIQVRFVHDASCQPIVERVRLSHNDLVSMDATLGAMKKRNLSRADRKYIIFTDSNVYCGIGTHNYDEKADASNQSNKGPGYARQDDLSRCVPGDTFHLAAAHELMHTLGAVNKGAPNYSGGGHCIDEFDNMCYGEVNKTTAANGKAIMQVCPPEHNQVYDCNHNDYFSTSPAPGSYLDVAWNAANSSFLMGTQPKPAVITSVGAPPPAPLPGASDIVGIAAFPKPGYPNSYWRVQRDGKVHTSGESHAGGIRSYDDTGIVYNAPIVGIAAHPSSYGYWLASSDGGVFAFGSARFYGSLGGIKLNKPIVGIAATPSGNGYWLAASDGGVFAFGDAKFKGSMGGKTLNRPIVGIAARPKTSVAGQGYWLVADDGGVFSFGSAPYKGSTGNIKLKMAVVGIVAHPSGNGYWMVGADGGIFAFGGAPFLGSTGSRAISSPVRAMAALPDGKGYWLAAGDGTVYPFGGAE
jgi:hypothetical protein